MKRLPHILTPPSLPRSLPDLSYTRTPELRKVAAFWRVPNSGKLPATQCRDAVERAWHDEKSARAAAEALGSEERAVLAAYRRYGNLVNGAVIRLDLLARGVLKVITERRAYGMRWSRYARNYVKDLAARTALFTAGREPYFFGGGYGEEADQPFPTYRLHPALVPWVEPAGPPPFQIATLDADKVQPLPAQPAAETALLLSRLFAYLATHSSVKVNRSGELSTPSLRALAKAVPIAEDADFPLPEPHGLFFELLLEAGAVVIDERSRQVGTDPDAAARLFQLSSAEQVHAWARGWLYCQGWNDGGGVGHVSEEYDDRSARGHRQILAWYLAALAHLGTPWLSLDTFLAALQAAGGRSYSLWFYGGNSAWDPDLRAGRNKEHKDGEERAAAYWFAGLGTWYANALMVTLPALGLVERGRVGPAREKAWAFRLTPLGRVVFGAPEVEPEPEAAVQRFLVVQPNFDVVAYLGQADVGAAALLGRVAESDTKAAGTAGPVQTFRLTQASVYQTLEGGLSHTELVEFLRRHSQTELPANVLQSLAEWSARRESMVLREGVTLLGFPSAEAATAYLTEHPGQRCGDRFVLAGKKLGREAAAGFLHVNHLGGLRPTWTVDDEGVIAVKPPLDVVQAARLRRIAEETDRGPRLTRASVHRAAVGGLKPATVQTWLESHTNEPLPPLIEKALYAWAGKVMPAALADVVLLHIPDPEQFAAVLESRRFRPFVLQSTGPGWVLVRKETRPELAALLDELGFSVGRDLPGPGKEK
jgi:hypothetical protein